MHLAKQLRSSNGSHITTHDKQLTPKEKLSVLYTSCEQAFTSVSKF